VPEPHVRIADLHFTAAEAEHLAAVIAMPLIAAGKLDQMEIEYAALLADGRRFIARSHFTPAPGDHLAEISVETPHRGTTQIARLLVTHCLQFANAVTAAAEQCREMLVWAEACAEASAPSPEPRRPDWLAAYRQRVADLAEELNTTRAALARAERKPRSDNGDKQPPLS